MPTREEIDELIEGCDWEWVEDFNGSGVNGQFGTSMSNCATIFLPAAGSRLNTDFDSVGVIGSYWSSLLSENGPVDAYCLFFINFSGIDRFNSDCRNYGQSVRAVLR